VKRLNDAQRHLLGANDQLCSALHPDALGLVFGGTPTRVLGHLAQTTCDQQRRRHLRLIALKTKQAVKRLG
jgi:hypothetical protein